MYNRNPTIIEINYNQNSNMYDYSRKPIINYKIFVNLAITLNSSRKLQL